MVVDWAEVKGNSSNAEDEECGVYMTNVKEDVEDEAFRTHCGKFGTIEKVRERKKNGIDYT